MVYQWFPGHMTKAFRMMEEDIKLIDLVIELVDARAPLATRNPDIDKLAQGKARMILLNKADLADLKINDEWNSYFEDKGYSVVKINSRTGEGIGRIRPAIQEACRAKIERDRKRGIKNRPVRAMVVGIPNVGKSTFINSLAGKAAAKTGNKPGVTKGKQWISLGKNMQLLDTPGILWPKFEDQEVGLHLALIGSMNDENLDSVELACELIKILDKYYPGAVKEKYNITDEQLSMFEQEQYATKLSAVLSAIAANRKLIKQGAVPDIDRASALILDDFRNGRLGRLSLEIPN